MVARDMSLQKFVASRHWVSHFKTKYRIVSRKIITNIVTKHEVAMSDATEQSTVDFLDQYKKLAKDFSPDHIYNTDQVGVEKELHSTRSLSFQAEKKTYGVVRSKNATTHSYTLQPMISLSGSLIGPIFLCLQEPGGKMGPIVRLSLFETKDVCITCSSSGKLTSSLVLYWRDHCLVPNIGDKSLLLSDS